jgi:hypothetical protein
MSAGTISLHQSQTYCPHQNDGENQNNENEGFDCLQRISHINPIHFIVIGETEYASDSFLTWHGWIPRGEACIRQQIIIGSCSFSTIAAVRPLRYLCWRIYECNVTHAEYIFCFC